LGFFVATVGISRIYLGADNQALVTARGIEAERAAATGAPALK
jgi:hypothetical protein